MMYIWMLIIIKLTNAKKYNHVHWWPNVHQFPAAASQRAYVGLSGNLPGNRNIDIDGGEQHVSD